MVTINRSADNYATVERDGQTIMQIMYGGMFGRNLVIIENNGRVTPVKDFAEAESRAREIASSSASQDDKWAREVFAQIESLVDKASIHIGRDVVGRLPHIPENFIRSITSGITPRKMPKLSRQIIRGS